MQNAARGAVLGLLALSILILAFAVGYVARGDDGGSAAPAANSEAKPSDAEGEFDFAALNEMLDMLKDKYVDPDRIDEQTLYEAAINGMLSTLSDSGTYYVDPVTLKIRTSPSSGSFEGIGASVRSESGQIVIVAPIKDTPADRAGIRSGDVVLEVDGESTEGWTEDKAVYQIRGKKGTTVTLKVRHEDGTEETLAIVRDTIEETAVSTDPPGGVLEDGAGNEATDLAYIHIQQFFPQSADELEAAIQEAIDSGKKGIILDLRNNPGGLLDTTVDIADMFLDGGTVLTERDRDGSERVYEAKPGGIATDIPIVVLINRFSASASEVLSAALHDNGRATLVGEKSFGKGTVNISRGLEDGGELYVTIGRWLTPAGAQIDTVGISPDIAVEFTDEDIDLRRDTQLMKAVDVLHGTNTAPVTSAPEATPVAGG